MKNKQVKQMICRLMSNRDGYDYEWRHYENQGKKNLSAGLFLMPECESSVVYFGKPISINAMDHWLFLRNHKIEKESWQVTIK